MDNKIEQPFKNIIGNKEIKEKVGDTVISFLIKEKSINQRDLKHLSVEFGYLLEDYDNGIVTLVKVKTAGGLFKKEKIFFLAIQQGELMLLNLNELSFRNTSDNMLKMHSVDIDGLDKKDYFMELY